MSGIISGLIGGAAAVALIVYARRTQLRATISHDGTRRLRAGWLMHMIFAISLVFTGLMVCFFVGGGSSLADADTRNIAAAFIGFASAACAASVGWSAYGRIISWTNTILCVVDIFGRQSRYSINSVQSIEECTVSGEYSLVFNDGSRVRFSTYLHGSDQLASFIAQRLGKK